jgi:hypothetical protein
MDCVNFYGPIESLISEYNEKKQMFVKHGLIQDPDRYYYLDGIEEGLRIAWNIFNDMTHNKKISV